MSPSYVSVFILVAVMLLIISEQTRIRRTVRRIQNRKKRGRFSDMKQLIQRFLKKEIEISSVIGAVRGTLSEVSDNAVCIETKKGERVVNIDYIYSVKEVRHK